MTEKVCVCPGCPRFAAEGKARCWPCWANKRDGKACGHRTLRQFALDAARAEVSFEAWRAEGHPGWGVL